MKNKKIEKMFFYSIIILYITYIYHARNVRYIFTLFNVYCT